LDATSAVHSPKVSNIKEDFDGFKTVTYRKKTTIAGPTVITVRYCRQPLVGMRNSASLPVISQKERFKLLFFLIFSPEDTADDVEKSLNQQLGLRQT
jgi:hypothetical protein